MEYYFIAIAPGQLWPGVVVTDKIQSIDQIVSKVGDLSLGWPEGSLFDSYYTKI